MAINRAPFNALVDDNGTGLTGSVWNKAAIASVILDPADAAYAPAAAWQNVTFNVANFWAGITAGMITTNRIWLQGKLMIWQLNIAGGPAPGTPTPYLPIIVPNSFPILAGGCMSPVTYASDTPSGVIASQAFVLTSTQIGVAKLVATGGANWSGTVNIQFTAILALQ